MLLVSSFSRARFLRSGGHGGEKGSGKVSFQIGMALREMLRIRLQGEDTRQEEPFNKVNTRNIEPRD